MMGMPEGTVRAIGERALIERLSARTGVGRHVTVGIGDDAAVARTPEAGHDWVFTTDPVVEGVHFSPGTEPERIGHKAAGRVLSDLAAMGAHPLWLLVNLVAPDSVPASRLERIYDGLRALAVRHGAAIIGGDVSGGGPLQLHVFGVGHLPCDTALTRRNACPGEYLYVTGTLGGSAAGRHLDFEPRVEEGVWLRAEGWSRAAMDISDGLASDLFHLLEASRVGARIRLDAIPVSPDANALDDGQSALAHALEDGEDFELLFTIAPDRADAFEAAWSQRFPLRCTRIGTLTDAPGHAEALDAEGRVIPFRKGGFEHFRTATKGPRP